MTKSMACSDNRRIRLNHHVKMEFSMQCRLRFSLHTIGMAKTQQQKKTTAKLNLIQLNFAQVINTIYA